MTATQNHESQLRGTRTTSGEPVQGKFKLYWSSGAQYQCGNLRGRGRRKYGVQSDDQEGSQETSKRLLQQGESEN